MQMVKNIVIFLILLPLVVVVFAPKKELYFLLEKRLYEKNIVISNEELDEGWLGLTIVNPDIYYNGAIIATAEKIELWSLLLYTKVDFINLKIAEGLPTEASIQSVNVVHSILDPMNIKIDALSSLGSIEGRVSLSDRKVRLDIAKDGNIKAFAKYLKRDKKGRYYESKF